MVYAKYQLRSDVKNEIKFIKLNIIPDNHVEVFKDISKQLNIDMGDILLHLVYKCDEPTMWKPYVEDIVRLHKKEGSQNG